jgi:hypothetical protein
MVRQQYHHLLSLRTYMNDLTQKLIAALVIVPILLAIFRGPKEMSIAASAIVAALIFANLDKFKYFKVLGTEGELRTAVDDAYAAIAQLRDLGIALSSPIVDDLAVSGRLLQYLPLKYKLERVATIAETLRKLGASEKEIDGVTATLYGRVTQDHIVKILRSLRTSNPEKEQLFKGLDDAKTVIADKTQLDQFIKGNNLQISDDAAELISDLDFFIKNKKLRRDDQWQS